MAASHRRVAPDADRRTLTNLYNQRPTWLDLAHTTRWAVSDAYGRPHDLSDEQKLERLLTLNLERAAGTSAAAALVTPERG